MKKSNNTLYILKDCLYTKLIITTILVISFLLLPRVGFCPAGGEVYAVPTNVFFPLVHANVFHLLCNIACLWQLYDVKRLLFAGCIVSFLCSFLPESLHDIMGCSGIIFAMIGFRFGEYGRFNTMVKAYALFFVITAFIPNVAVLFHIYCLVMAYIAGNLYQTLSLLKKATCI